MGSPPVAETETAETVEVDGGLTIATIWSLVAVIVAVIIVVIWMATSGSGDPVAAAEAEPLVVFDGSGCVFEGPTEIREGPVSFMVTNETTQNMYMVLTSFAAEADLTTELDFLPVGSHTADPYTDREMPGATREASQFGPPNGRNARIALLTPGWFVVDCVNWPPAAGEPDHAWRGAVFQIVE